MPSVSRVGASLLLVSWLCIVAPAKVLVPGVFMPLNVDGPRCCWFLDVSGPWMFLIPGCFWSLDVSGLVILTVPACRRSLHVAAPWVSLIPATVHPTIKTHRQRRSHHQCQKPSYRGPILITPSLASVSRWLFPPTPRAFTCNFISEDPETTLTVKSSHSSSPSDENSCSVTSRHVLSVNVRSSSIPNA